MSVKLREKQLSDGRISLYLDIYHEKKRRYDFLEIYLEGKRSSPENREKLQLAERIKLDTEHQLSVQQRNLPNDKLAYTDVFTFIARYPQKKQDRLKSLVTHLKGFAGERLAFRLITKDWLLNFQAYLKRDPDRIENTITAYMRTLNNVLNDAVAEDILLFNPWKKVPTHLKTKMTVPDVDPLEVKEIRQLLSKSDGVRPQLLQCFMLSLFTGLRWSDVSNLKKSSIRVMYVKDEQSGKLLRRKFVFYTQRKTKVLKNLPLSKEAIRMLAARLLDERREINNRREAGLKAEPSDSFFPLYALKAGERSNKRHGSMSQALKRWVKNAGITKRVHFHLTRHTFATLGLEELGDLRIIQDLLGHSKIATTQRYSHVLDRLKVKSIDRMAGFGVFR